jgi:hypothetical protein
VALGLSLIEEDELVEGLSFDPCEEVPLPVLVDVLELFGFFILIKFCFNIF